MNRIDVTCAIIIKGKKILACQRGNIGDNSLEWEFPGGKVEKGEQAKNCIVRELHEELNIRAEVIKKLKPIEYHYPTKHIRLIPFICKIADGILTPTEHAAICWHPIDQFAILNWSDADVKLFHTNQKEIQC